MGQKILIIFDKSQEIAAVIHHKMHYGAMFIHEIGAYTKKDKTVSLSIKRELNPLKSIDRYAFISVNPVYETLR
ncbi:MAG: hypothetical protein K2G70_01580 [Turicibacter sp.]|nr:hypothetical protein [Turicibacter sp.]